MTLTEAHQILIERHKRACEELHKYVINGGENGNQLCVLRAEEQRAADELARFNRIKANLEESKS